MKSTKNKKILFITHLYYPSIGGAEKVYQQWAELLVKRSHQVTVLTTNAQSTEDYYKFKKSNEALLATEVLNGALIYRQNLNSFAHKIAKYLWLISNKYSILRHSFGPLFFGPHFIPFPKNIYGKKFDLIIAGPTPTSTIFYAYALSLVSKTKLIIFPHFHPEDLLHAAFVNKILFNKAAKIISTTNSEAKLVSKIMRVPEDKIIRINNTIDTSFLKNHSKNTNSLVSDINEYVLFFGQEGRHKNIPILLEAMEKLWSKGVKNKLVIAGKRTDFSAELDEIIETSKYKNNVLRFNEIPESQKIAFFDNAAVLVNPSYHESFGLVFIEAWARKKPVIGNDIPAVSELIVNGENGLIFDYNNVQSLTQAINTLLSDKIKMKKFGSAGYKKVITEFTEESLNFDQLFL